MVFTVSGSLQEVNKPFFSVIVVPDGEGSHQARVGSHAPGMRREH